MVVALSVVPTASAGQWVAEWAPEDTLMFIGVPNFDDLIDSTKKISAYKMYQDPAIKDTIRPFKKIMENAQKMLAKELGIDSPKELELYPHGGVVLIASATDKRDDKGKPKEQFAAIMDMGEDLDRARKLVKKIISRCLDKGATKSVSKASGIEITNIKFAESKADESEEKDDRDSSIANAILENTGVDDVTGMMLTQILDNLHTPEEFATAFFESRLLVGSDAEALKVSIRQLKKGAKKSLAESPAGRLLKRKCNDKAQIQFVVNIPRILALAAGEDAEKGKRMRATGVQSFGAMVTTVELAVSDKMEFRLRGHMEIGSDPTGVPKLFMMKNTKTTPPATMPADSLLCATVNVNPSDILSEVIAISTRIDPADGERMRAGLKVPQPDGSVLDIQKDIVDHIVGPLSISLSASSPFKRDDFNFLMAIGHKSRDAVTKLMAMVPPGMLIPSEMLGETIYETPMVPGAAMGITDRVIIPVATKKAVEAHIRSEGKEGRGLANDPDFKAIAKHVPKKSSAMFYVNALRGFDAQAAIVKAGDVNLDGSPMPGMHLGDILRLSFAKQSQARDMDNPDALRKYQSSIIFTVRTESDGLRFDAVGTKARIKN
jgi:hypothetical protein